MQDRYEATSEIARRLHPTSEIGDAHLELAVHLPPGQAAATLPDLYGELRFELLVVDPDWAFAAWEVPSSPAGATLQLRLIDASNPGPALAGYNLGADTGRRFIHHALPGRLVYALLGLASGTSFTELQRRGPVQFPRNTAIDADHFVELSVDYDRGPQGQLLLAALQPRDPQPWPEHPGAAAYPPWALDWLDGAGGDSAHPGSSIRRAGHMSSGSSVQLQQGGPSDV